MNKYFYKMFDEEDGEYLVSLVEEVVRFCEKLRHTWERANILNDWKKWSVKIKVANEVLSSDLLGVYVFGSAITGRLVAYSDVDMLVVAKNLLKSIIKSLR